jgi:crotonobetainyl-CoA:carnitine CoA-transferase CaiB-like acyl-CoA transferase
MHLGDLGAHVVKIERTGTGDESRAWGPPFDARGESAYYLCCNRNKLSIAVDLAVAADRNLVRELIAAADVVMDNFLPGALAKLGLDPEALVAAHPRLVWCTVTGFARAPGRPGYDYVVQAESGWMAITGEPGGEPVKVGVALADILAGKEAVAATLAALAGLRAGLPVERRLTVPLYETAVAALVNVAQNALVSGAATRRWGNAHANLVPYESFPTADRTIVIAVGNDAQFVALVSVLGSAALRDPRFGTNAGRVTHRSEVVMHIRAALAARPASEWLAALDAAGVPCGRVNTVEEALAQVEASPISGVAPQPPGRVRRPPPRLDEHGALVRQHGWQAFTIADA